MRRFLVSRLAAGGVAAAATAAAAACEAPSVETLRKEIKAALINEKVNACPMAVRVAWHAAGTFDKSDASGGSDGATMRFAPESEDAANAGLSIIHDLLLQVKLRHPDVSIADLWTLAGCSAVEFIGGPKVKHTMGRSDAADGSHCPPNGRLPDATQGAAHLRQVFGRMGFNDQEIVALSGAHTLGRCHYTRSGFDGPWTSNSLRFDNEYFRNLLDLEWEEKVWGEGMQGNRQFTDTATKKLTMLPTDLALRDDPKFRKYVEIYARDEKKFFDDFAAAFAKLVALGCPDKAPCRSGAKGGSKLSNSSNPSAEWRELAMHGSLDQMTKLLGDPRLDVHEADGHGRTALHKAAFWGHTHVASYLTRRCYVNVNVVDYAGDTPLHDAAKFGHAALVRVLLDVGADASRANKAGQTPLDLARLHGKGEVEKELLARSSQDTNDAAKQRRDRFMHGGSTS